MEEFKVLIGAELKSGELEEIRNQIQNMQITPIQLRINTQNVQSQLNNIRNQIQNLGRIRINLNGGNGGGNNGIQRTLNETTRAYNDLMNLARRINSIRLEMTGLDGTKNSGQITELSGQLNRLMTDYNNLYNTFNRSFSTDQIDNLNRAFETTNGRIADVNAKMADTSAIQKQTSAYKELLNISKQIGNLELRIAGLDGKVNANEIAELTSQLNNLRQTYQQMQTAMQGKLTPTQMSELSAMVYDTQDKLNLLNAKVADVKAKLASGIQVKLDNGKFDADISNITAKMSKLSTVSDSLSQDFVELQTHLNNMRMATGVDEMVAEYTQYENVLDRINNKLKEQANAQRLAIDAQNLESAKSSLSLKMDSWLKQNSAAAAKFGAEIENLKRKLQSCNAIELDGIQKEFDELRLKAGLAGKTGKTLGDSLKAQFKSFGTYFGVSMLYSSVIRGAKDMYQNVVKVDTAMTELKKVTNETEFAYKRFLNTASGKSQQIGTTIDGYINSTADFARLGYTIKQSNELAEVANIYAVVGDEIDSVDTATKSIISTVQAFDIEAENAMTIVDKFNEVGNNFAISSGGIGEAMTRSASSMKAANNTIDETIALITAANTVVQNPDSIGTAFKTVSMRIRGAETELKEAGLETEGMAESTAKLQAEIKALSGVDIMKDKNTFKSTYQILDELSVKWKDLTDIQQASITELIAGKRQGNIISSLMNNFDTARRALETSQNSEGSALKEHEKWLESAEAKIQQLKAAWQQLSLDFLSSDFLKWAIDRLKELVNGLDSVVEILGGLGTIVAGVGIKIVAEQSIQGLTAYIAGKGGLIAALTAIPPHVAIAVGAIAALGIAGKVAYDTWYDSQYHWSKGLSKGNEKIEESLNKYKELTTTQREIKDLNLVINNPESSQKQVEDAKSRLDEIREMLSEEYNLTIKSDNSTLQETVDTLKDTAKNELKTNTNMQMSKLINLREKYDSYDAEEYQNAIKEQTKYSELMLKVSNINSKYSAGSSDPEVLKARTQALKELGAAYGFTAEEIAGNSLNISDLSIKYQEATEKVERYKDLLGSHDEYIAISKEIANWQTELINMAALEADDEGVKNALSNMGELIRNAELDMNGYAQAATLAMNGVDNLESAWSKAYTGDGTALQGIINGYIRAMKEFGATSEEVVQGSALIANGFRTSSDAIARGDEAVQGVLKGMKEMGESQGLFEGMNFEQITVKLTEMAQAMELIPKRTSLAIDADGNFNIIYEAQEVIDKLNKQGKIKFQLEKNGNITLLESTNETLKQLMQNGDISFELNVTGNGLNVLNKTGEKIAQIDGETGEVVITSNIEVLVSQVEQAEENLQKLGKTKFSFDFNSDSLQNIDIQIIEAQRILNEFKKEDGSIDLSIEGASDAQAVLATLIQQKQALSEQPTVMKVDTSQVSGDVGTAITLLQNFQNTANQLQIEKAIGVDTSDTEAKLQTLATEISQLPSEVTVPFGLEGSVADALGEIGNVDISAGVNISEESIASVTGAIQAITPEIMVSAGIDATLISGYTPDNKEADVIYHVDDTEVDTYTPDNKEADVIYHIKTEGSVPSTPSPTPSREGNSPARGTAFATGTAFKSGNWGTQSSGVALGGELGQELVVRDGHFFTIGDKSAEFFKYEKGDIIFNAEQTKQIFEKGKITTGNRRGRAFADGTAFTGKAFADGSTDEKKENFDWIEKLIDRTERKIESLSKKAESAYRSFSERNLNLEQQISSTKDEIGYQQQAYDKYIEKANSLGLDESYIKKIQDGSLDIDTITDENLIEKIQEYTEWYEKALDCKDAIDDLNESVKDLNKTLFENKVAEFDSVLGSLGNKSGLLEAYLEKAETRGYTANSMYYKGLQNVELENIARLKEEQEVLTDTLNKAVDSGEIEVYSEAWYEMQSQIDEVTQSVVESETAFIEYHNAIRQINWDAFDTAREKVKGITEEAEFLINLLDNGLDGGGLYNDDGSLTDTGMATMGLHGVNYNTHMENAKSYAEEIERINNEISLNPDRAYDENLLARKDELIELQRESILAAKDEKDAMIDMVEEGIEYELDSLQELIDSYNEALDAEKDLYDYQKKVSKQSKEIASIQKQLAAYANDTSEESKAKVQELKVSLEEAEEELREAEYDKYISDQKDLLDNLYTEYSDVLNGRLDNVDELIEDVISGVNSNSDGIKDTLKETTSNLGIDISTTMNEIWSSDDTDVLKSYQDGVTSKMTSLVASIGNIERDLGAIHLFQSQNATGGVDYVNSHPFEALGTPKEETEIATTSSEPIVEDVVSSIGDFFISKKNDYPSSKLNIEQSIVDRLAYFDFDNSFSARAGYYKSMGFDGEYRSNAEQNIKMLNWMKQNGYKNGVYNLNKDEWAWTQENGQEVIIRPSDGAILTPLARQDSVLNAKATSNLFDFTNNPTKFIKENLGVGYSDIVPVVNTGGETSYHGDINFEVILPNVMNYEQLKYAMQHDTNFEKMLKSITVDKLVGGSALRKYN